MACTEDTEICVEGFYADCCEGIPATMITVRPALKTVRNAEITIRTAAKVMSASIVRVRPALLKVKNMETFMRTAVVL